MCTVKCDNHRATSSCKNYTYNTLLMLTGSTIMQYIIYFFIRIFLLQRLASVFYMKLKFKKISLELKVAIGKKKINKRMC